LLITKEIERSGATSHNAIAAKLNERHVRTARGGKWTHVQVGAAPPRSAWNGIIARQIIELARAGERNPDLLCEGALEKLRGALFGD
jgi:hypothetical protein